MGSWVVTRLLEDPRHSVVALTHRSPPKPEWSRAADVDIWHADLRDSQSLEAAWNGRPIDVIIHCAATISSAADQDPVDAALVNMVGTLSLLTLAARRGVRRFVLVSTGSVYGVTGADGPPLREDQPLTFPPRSMYAATKLAAEQAGLTFGSQQDIEVIVVRISRVFGYGRLWPRLPIDDLVQECLAHGTMTLGAEINLRYEYTYVRDTVAGLVHLAEYSELAHRVYNVSSGRLVSGQQVVDMLKAIVPSLTLHRLKEDRPKNYPYLRPPLSNARIGADAGWQPAWSLDAALADYVTLASSRALGRETSA